MKQVAGRLRLEYAQYRELEAFAQFGSDLDQATQRQLARGQRIVEVLKQPQYRPVSVEKQIAIIYAVTNGYLDDVEPGQVRQWETDFHQFMDVKRPEVLEAIRNRRVLDDDLIADLKSTIDAFRSIE